MRLYLLYVFLFVAIEFFLQSCSDSSTTSAKGISDTDTLAVQLPFVGGKFMFTEVSPANVSYSDSYGNTPNWVEFFNVSVDTVNMRGLSLTDSKSEPRKWIFGDVLVLPNSFMVVFLSGKNILDYVPPHDSVSMIGRSCWAWTDAQGEPAGYSYANPLAEKSKICFIENGARHFGATMQFGENEELGWSSISVFIATGSGKKDDVSDLSNTNEILMHAYISKGSEVSFRLVQPDIDDWKAYEIRFTGSGDSSTVYRAALPTNTKFPDLKNIYGTRMSPYSNEVREVTVKVFDYIARNRGSEAHTSFKLKNFGTLYLVNENSEIIDSVAYPETPLGYTWSFGKISETKTGFGFAHATPYSLSTEYVYPLRSPNIRSIIPASGFYKEPFAISFEDSVRCEFSGKAPLQNSRLVKNLNVDSTLVLRCANFMQGSLKGEEIVRTYIFENAPTVPAIFITADSNSLFSLDSGIYAEGEFMQNKEPHYGANYWQNKEIPVMVEFLEPGVNAPAFAKYAGLEIFGNYSRQNDKKSVAITFREKYGDKRLHYKLFPEFPELENFKSFVLRNNGSNFGNDYIRDKLASSISEGLGVDYQRARAAVVFYNSMYFGLHNIRERSTKYYFETHYGINPDDIDLLKADNSVSAGSAADYIALENWLQTNHLNDSKNYDYVAAQIDISNYINYMQTELFANNRDWPANNFKKWRTNNPKSLWKRFIYDMDYGFGNNYSNFKNNIFEYATSDSSTGWPNGAEYTLLFRRLLENENFKNAFINRFSVLLATNFSESKISAQIYKLMNEISAEISRDQERWHLNAMHMENQLNVIKEFAKNRQAEIYSEMSEYFGLKNMLPVTLSVKGSGKILVDGLKLQTSLTLNFFENIPVTLTALPEAGRVFVGWSDGNVELTRTIDATKISSLTAVFK